MNNVSAETRIESDSMDENKPVCGSLYKHRFESPPVVDPCTPRIPMSSIPTPIIHHHQLGNGRHALETVTHFPLPVEDVFPFFCDVQNLERITPPELAFRVLTPGPVAIGLDTLVDYRLGLFGIPFGWRSRISVWEPPLCFVDEQLRGPYHTWIHRHTFETVADGTRMTDRVGYRLPLHPLSGLALPLVRRQLNQIFVFRGRTIRRLLAEQ